MDDSNNITVYRVSFDTSAIQGDFIPRVPESTMNGEDKTTPRICFATSIEGCISAMPKYNRKLAIGERFMLYVLNISSDDPYFVSNQDLDTRELVPDAIYTGECWYTKPVKLVGELYEIVNFAWGHYFFPIEKDRPLIYEKLRGLGVDEEHIVCLDKFRVFEVINDILNSNPYYWEFDDILGDSIANDIGIPGSLLFDYLETKRI